MNCERINGFSHLLKTLKLNRRIGLVSDGYLHFQKKKFKLLNIGDYFDSVLFTGSLGKEYWKPSFVPFVRILMDLNSKPKETLNIVDNPKKDFYAPNRLVMYSVRFKHPMGIYQRLETKSKDYALSQTVTNVDELLGILLND